MGAGDSTHEHPMPGARSTRPLMLIVDDDDVLRERLARAFRGRGYEVVTAADHDTALACARVVSLEFAVVDLRLSGRSGLEVVRELRALDPATRIVILTGYGSIATAVESMRLGAANYLPKPADADDILAALGQPASTMGSPATIAADPPTLARAEWEHINRVLTASGGNVSQAARRLGLHRRSLQRKLRKYPPRS